MWKSPCGQAQLNKIAGEKFFTASMPSLPVGWNSGSLCATMQKRPQKVELHKASNESFEVKLGSCCHAAAMQLPCCLSKVGPLTSSKYVCNPSTSNQHPLHFPKEFRILLAFASSKLKVYWLRRRYFILICKSCFPGHSRHDSINASG